MSRPDTFDRGRISNLVRAFLDELAGWGFGTSVAPATKIYAPPSRTEPNVTPPAHYGFPNDDGSLVNRVYFHVGTALVGPHVLADGRGMTNQDLSVKTFRGLTSRVHVRINDAVGWAAWNVVKLALGGSYVQQSPPPGWDGDAGFAEFIGRITMGLRETFRRLEDTEPTVEPHVAVRLKAAGTCGEMRNILIRDTIAPAFASSSE